MAKTSGATERIQQILTEPEEFVTDKAEKDIASAQHSLNYHE